MPVQFKVLPTGNQELEQVQQNITDLANSLQAAQAQAGQGITQTATAYTLQSTDRYLLVSSNSTVTLGSPSVALVSVIINVGTDSVAVRTGDNKTDLGTVAPGQSATVVCNGKSWSRV